MTEADIGLVFKAPIKIVTEMIVKIIINILFVMGLGWVIVIHW